MSEASSPHSELRERLEARAFAMNQAIPGAVGDRRQVLADDRDLLFEAASLYEQKEATDAALGKIALMQSGALAIIRDNGFVFEDIGKEPGNWQHLAFTLYNLICEIDVQARHALGIEIGEDPYPASEPEAS